MMRDLVYVVANAFSRMTSASTMDNFALKGRENPSAFSEGQKTTVQEDKWGLSAGKDKTGVG